MDKNDEDNLFTLLLILAGVGLFGAFSVANLIAPVRDWLVDIGALVTGPDVLVPLLGGTGLDLGRTVIAAGAVLLLLVVAVAVVTRVRKGRRHV